ncbi:MAG TPA: acetyltransferase [Mycobacteriales bacterium]|nr:acetyltransferase [Mycobacteriales bacterium]
MSAVPLLLVGCGGFARETACAVHAVNSVAPTFRLLGFLDDAPNRQGTVVDGLPVLGPVEAALAHPEARLVVCTGSPRDYSSRRRIVSRLGLPPDAYATVVHPAASLAAGATLGPGTVLLAGVVVTAPVAVGAHVAVMPHVVLTHDDEVGDDVTFGAGVRLGGGTVAGNGCYVGSGALVREGVRIGAGALVGMGAVVLRDVPPREVWAGVPARRVRAAA